MGTQRMVLLGVLLTVWVAPNVWASDHEQEAADFSREGLYIGVSGVFVSEQWAGSIDDVGAEDTHGLNLRAGFRISPLTAVELELELIDDFFPDERQDFRIVTGTVNTRIYPLGGMLGHVQPFALAGLGIVSTIVDHRDRDTNIKQSNADWGFRGGGGVDFYYTEHVAVSAEATYVWTVGDVKNIDHVSIGLGILYRF